MIGPDQDLSDFPRWIWPYIRVEQLAKSRALGPQENQRFESAPREVLLGHYAALVQAVHLHSMATRIGGEVGIQIGNAAKAAIAEEIDDWCGTKPHPHPHRAGELGTLVAALASSSTNERLRGELTAVVDQIASRMNVT
jgi:hypothetical protein